MSMVTTFCSIANKSTNCKFLFKISFKWRAGRSQTESRTFLSIKCTLTSFFYLRSFKNDQNFCQILSKPETKLNGQLRTKFELNVLVFFQYRTILFCSRMKIFALVQHRIYLQVTAMILKRTPMNF